MGGVLEARADPEKPMERDIRRRGVAHEDWHLGAGGEELHVQGHEEPGCEVDFSTDGCDKCRAGELIAGREGLVAHFALRMSDDDSAQNAKTDGQRPEGAAENEVVQPVADVEMLYLGRAVLQMKLVMRELKLPRAVLVMDAEAEGVIRR